MRRRGRFEVSLGKPYIRGLLERRFLLGRSGAPSLCPSYNVSRVTCQVKGVIVNETANHEKLEKRNGAIRGSFKGSKNRRA